MGKRSEHDVYVYNPVSRLFQDETAEAKGAAAIDPESFHHVIASFQSTIDDHNTSNPLKAISTSQMP
jgi:hypothetical protein